jgi:hypothetical protein
MAPGPWHDRQAKPPPEPLSRRLPGAFNEISARPAANIFSEKLK